MDSHTHMQLLVPWKPGKRDALDFSLQTPQKRRHCPNLWNLQTSEDSSSCTAETQPHLWEKEESQLNQSHDSGDEEEVQES